MGHSIIECGGRSALMPDGDLLLAVSAVRDAVGSGAAPAAGVDHLDRIVGAPGVLRFDARDVESVVAAVQRIADLVGPPAAD